MPAMQNCSDVCKNEAGERRLVYVTSEGEVVPKKKMNRLKSLI